MSAAACHIADKAFINTQPHVGHTGTMNGDPASVESVADGVVIIAQREQGKRVLSICSVDDWSRGRSPGPLYRFDPAA